MKLERYIGVDNKKEINIYDRHKESLINLDEEARKVFHENPNHPQIKNIVENCFIKNGPLMKNNWHYPMKTYLMITNECNLRCKYCYLKANNKIKNELSTTELKKLIDELDEIGTLLISFNGGEPLIRKDIIEILKYTEYKKIGFSISTNGLLINEKIAKSLGELDGWIKISLDGKENTHDYLRGEGTYKKIKQNISLLYKYNVKFILQMTVTKYNYAEMADVAKFAKKVGARYIKYNLIRPSGRALDNSELCNLTKKELEQIDKEIIKINKININKVYSHDFPHFDNIKKGKDKIRLKNLNFGCSAGRTAISIRPSGNITPCIFFPEDMDASNVREGVKNTIENSPVFKEIRNYKANSKCSNCPDLKDCSGGCRARAYVATLKINGIDPFCKRI